MDDYLASRWIRTGLVLVAVGAGPLLLVVVASAVGLWPGRDPNPVGLGLLFALTFWPAVFCLVVGAIRVRMSR